MIVALDTTALCLLLNPNTKPPDDPKTKKPVEHARARVEHLIDGLERAGARIIIPATVWAEFLVAADESGPDYLAELSNRVAFEIVPFDTMSAVEAGASQRNALKTGNKKADLSASRQCVKADMQIVAVAKTQGVDSIVAGDADIAKIGATMGVKVQLIWDLPVPPAEEPELPFTDQPSPESAGASTAPEQPSERSPTAAAPKAQPSEPGRPSAPPDAPEPQPPGSSPTVPPPPRPRR
jgi:predicted nucleic acid-binding protein